MIKPSAAKQAQKDGSRPESNVIPTIPSEAHFPMSYVQEHLWSLQQLDPGSSAGNIQFGVRLSGPLNKDALTWSLRELVCRHDALRTTFVSSESGLSQVIHSDVELQVAIEDLREIAEAGECEKEAHRRVGEMATEPFDLSRGPLLRARLLQMEEREHVLAAAMHQIIGDRWSCGIMMRELGDLYEARVKGKELKLAELKIQYTDYALWRQEAEQRAALERQTEYWRERLAGLEPLDMPTDHVRSGGMSQRRGQVWFSLAAKKTEALKEMSRREGVTLFMTLLAGLALTLSKHSGQEDVAVGTPVANRGRAELEGLIGPFENTVVMLTKVRAGLTLREFLGEVKGAVLEAYEHQDLPFERLVEALQPGLGLSRTPFFQASLSLESAAPWECEKSGLRWREYAVGAQTPECEMHAAVREREGRIEVEINYAQDLYGQATMEEFGRCWQVALEPMVEQGEQLVADLSLLTGEEREKVLVEWNRTEANYPEKCVHALFEEQAEKNPGRVAVSGSGGEELSYQELNRKANQLGQYLKKLGVGPETRVGICLERGVEMMVALLGVLKAGGAYVPLDASYPQTRLSYMLRDSMTKVLLSQHGLLKNVDPDVLYVDINEKREEIASESEQSLENNCTPRSLAYVMYTSGSTGVPKGVAIEHKSIVRLVRQTNYFHAAEDEIFLQLAPFSFDASTFEIWGCLLNGGKLATPESQMLSLEELGREIESSGATVMWLTAGLFHQMVEGPVEKLRGVRQLLAGGDVLHAPHVKRALEKLPQTRIINGYGPTENTTFTCCYGMEPAMAGQIGENVPIGTPIHNTKVYVMDKFWQPVPVGVAGELCIGGAGLAREYLNQPALTAEKFIPDPFSVTPGERLYRTGDRVRWTRRGQLEFLGRLDQQVKIRGFRIELGEIECVLQEHAEIEQAVVVVRDGGAGGKQLIAYIVRKDAEEGKRLEISELREYVRKRLPEYMVPGAWVAMETLPLTWNGKVDRKALPEPEWGEAEEEQNELGTAEEEAVRGILAEVLKRERVGLRQNFFEIGGHSLLATQVVSRVKSALGVELPLRFLYEAPTAKALAEQVKAAKDSKTATEEKTELQLAPANREGDLPLSSSQERVWFLLQFEPSSIAYHFQGSLRISGPLDVSALERSLNEIVRRHEVLRTTFVQKNGHPVQVIHQAEPFSLPVVKVTPTDGMSVAETLDLLMRREMSKSFDISRLPLIRWTLFALGQEDFVLLDVEHHCIHDGWGFNVFVGELLTLYKAFAAGQPSPLLFPAIQFVDFAVWQRQFVASPVVKAQLEYWKKKLENAQPVSELPADRPRPPVQTFRGGLIRVPMKLEISRQARAFSRRQGVSLFVTMISAFFSLIHRCSGQDDLCVGSSVANRQNPGTEGLLGMLVNNLILRAQISGHLAFGDFVAQVRELTLEAYENQDVPFHHIVQTLGLERSLSVNPLFQTMFSFHSSPLAVPDLPGFTFELTEGLSNGSAKFDLSVIAIPAFEQRLRLNPAWDKDDVVMMWEFNSDLFDETTVRRMIGWYESLLESLMAHPERRILEPSLMSQTEWQQILNWNRTEREFGPDQCVHEMFVAQAEKMPEAVAVAYEEEQLTYADLDRRTNQLAHDLKGLGVGPDSRVAICAERSLEMVIGLLGILKAGGAYVPLDPEYPAERLRCMVENSKPVVLLAQSHLKQRCDAISNGTPVHDLREMIIERQSRNDACLETAAIGLTRSHLAYVIYTSGSTGTPKGIGISHGALSNHMQWMLEEFGYCCHDSILQKTSISFDASVWEFYAPLISGGRLVMLGRGAHRDPDLLGEEIVRREITVAQMVPTLLEAVLKAGKVDGRNHLRLIMCGGEALRSELAAPVWKDWKAEVVNLYGPTEATIDASFWRGVEQTESNIPIGKPIGNMRMHILDMNLAPAPVGVTGEIYIGGAGIARGYLDRPDLTAERFLPDPLGGQVKRGERLYRTGDLGRYRNSGEIEFLGRNDFQVKIRGFRIELDEIKERLLEYPGVKEAVVAAREMESGEKQLVAYCVMKEGEEPETEDLHQHLLKRLPQYMTPGVYVFLDSIPLSANGKVNQKALPLPKSSERLENQYVPPKTALELALCKIWQEILKVERVGIHDKFFELGGHSLAMVRVRDCVQETLKRTFPIVVMFEHSTVAALAAYLLNNHSESRSFGEVNGAVEQRQSRQRQREQRERRLCLVEQS